MAGTAEIIKLAISERLKPVTYLSTVGIADQIPVTEFEEDSDVRVMSAERQINDGYANGYGNSKWAGEVLLREAHDLAGLPVRVFRSDMILAHSDYHGQLNVTDVFTQASRVCCSPVLHRPASMNWMPTAIGSALTMTVCPAISPPHRSPPSAV